MTDKRISPLRQRMIGDMTVRGFTPSTQGGYLAAVENFTAFLGRSPDRSDAEDLRRYQLHMRSNGASATSMNSAVSALRFFFGVTLGRGDAQVPEFIRRFLIHVLPQGFHRIRHYGLFANGGRVKNLAQARELLDVPTPRREPDPVADVDEPPMLSYPCPSCGGPMIIIETFEPGHPPRAPPQAKADRT